MAMNSMRDQPISFSLFRDALRDVLKSWKPVTGYMAWFAGLNLAVLAPLTAFTLDWIVNTSGQIAVTNHDLPAFAGSVPGVLFLLSTTALYLAVLQLQVGGLTLLAAQAARQAKVSLWSAIRESTTRIPAFLRLSIIQAGAALGLIGSTVGLLMAIQAGLLGGHDINYYLSETPPEWWQAVTLAVLVCLASVILLQWIALRWLFAVPHLLLARTGARTSLRASWRLTRGRTPRIAGLLGAWWTGTTAIGALSLWMGQSLVNPLFAWAGLDPSRVLPLVALIGVATTVAATAWGILTLGVHQFFVTRLAIQLSELPGPLPADATRSRTADLNRDPRAAGLLRSSRPWGLASLSVLFLVLASALTGWVMFKNLELMNSVEITAHRGSSAKAPENTLAAFRQAIADGCDYIELDVQTCADGTVVVIHDRDLMRVGGDPRRVEVLTVGEIQQVDVGRRFSEEFTGEHVPTLAEVIELVRGKVQLNIELKYNRPDPELAPAVAELLRREQFLDQSVITSLNAEALREFKRTEPAVRVGLIVTAAFGRVTATEADFLSLKARRATPRAISEAQRANKLVHVWTVNEPQAMLRMIENGADNIITDKPDVLRTVLNERAKLSDPEKVALRLRVLFGGGVSIGSAGDSQQ